MKPQVLVYGNRKQDDMQFPFSTPVEKEKAFLELFKFLRKTWKVYDVSSMSQTQEILFNTVKDNIEKYPRVAGDAAIRLLTLRKNYEYEQWTIETVPVKVKGRLSESVVVKPHWLDVKTVRAQRTGGSVPSIRLVMKSGKEVEFLLVPHQTFFKDWDDVNAAQQFIVEAIQTEYKREMYNAEGLKKALDTVNELRYCVHMALHPETASPTCSPSKVIERNLAHAESLLEEYSNTPVKPLTTAKRRPTTLDEAQEELARARRTIDSLGYHLKKAGKEAELADVLRSATREIPA